MEKIKVMVNNVTNVPGILTATNIVRADDMELAPISVSSYRGHNMASVSQFLVELVTPSVLRSFITKTRFHDFLEDFGNLDVIVDHDPWSVFKDNIPDYLSNKSSFLLCTSASDQNLEKVIEGLEVNILLLPKDASEKEVLNGIKFLYQKNCQGKFGNIFTSCDLAVLNL